MLDWGPTEGELLGEEEGEGDFVEDIIFAMQDKIRN